jgi:hypothetical protein
MSRHFELKRGTAQGDSPSPFLYNLAAQVLLLKIELCSELQGIYPAAPQNFQDDLDTTPFAYESNGETNRNKSFADDGNNFLILSIQNLSTLKDILLKFRTLSGLECNVDKSYVMRIGDTEGEIDQAILDLGFPFTTELTKLGFIITNSANITEKNYEKIISKITNITRFLDRFNLSVPRKISIYKTLLLPQINFVATVQPPPPPPRYHFKYPVRHNVQFCYSWLKYSQKSSIPSHGKRWTGHVCT